MLIEQERMNHVLVSLFIGGGDTLSMFAECSLAFIRSLSMLDLRMSNDSVSYGSREVVVDGGIRWPPPPRKMPGTPKAFEFIA